MEEEDDGRYIGNCFPKSQMESKLMGYEIST